MKDYLGLTEEHHELMLKCAQGGPITPTVETENLIRQLVYIGAISFYWDHQWQTAAELTEFGLTLVRSDRS